MTRWAATGDALIAKAWAWFLRGRVSTLFVVLYVSLVLVNAVWPFAAWSTLLIAIASSALVMLVMMFDRRRRDRGGAP